jgi:hypothetical protein
MQPVPETAVCDADDLVAVRHIVDRARDGRDGAERAPRLPCELGRIVGNADRLHAAHLGVDSDERRHLTGVTAHDRDLELVQQPLRRLCPVAGRTGADGVEDDRQAAPVRCPAREQHRLDPVLRQRADVEHERARQPDHFLDLLTRMSHHR